jgi:hypothetical protein
MKYTLLPLSVFDDPVISRLSALGMKVPALSDAPN